MSPARLFGSVCGIVLFVASAHARAVIPELGPTIDYPAFADCLDGPSTTVVVECNRANFHPDTHVDLRDAAIVQRGYGLIPGEVQFATETAGQVHPIDDVDEYTFEGLFGSTVTVDYVTPKVNNRPDLVARLDLVRPNGSVAASTATCGTTARLDTINVDATGIWRVRVRAYENWTNCGYGPDDDLRTGLYTLGVCPSNAAPIPIAYGETDTNAFQADCQIINYGFSGTIGDVASIMYLGPASTRRVRLYAPNGALLATSSSGAGTSISDVSLPLTGSYRIAVEALDGSLGGEFSIGLSELGNATPIAFSTPTGGALTEPAQANAYTFDAEFGTSVTVDYATSMAGALPELVARMDLVRPNGTVAASTATCGLTARLDSVGIDMAGTWTVRVRAYESWFNCGYGFNKALLTGSYTLVVCPSNATPIPIAYGQSASAVFDVDCQIVNFQFAGQTGDIAFVMYLGPAHTRRVRLFAPNGALLATSGAGQGVSIADVPLPLDGLYQIAVEASDSQAVGEFTIGLSKLGTADSIAVDTATLGALSQIAGTASYAFDATFGARATVDFSTQQVAGRPDLAVRLELLRPDGSVASSTASCSTNARLDNVLIDATGTWTTRIRAYESWFNCGYGADIDLLIGAFTLAVSKSDEPATAIMYGETADGTLNVDSQTVNFEFTGSHNDVVSLLYFGTAYTRRVRLFAPNGSLLSSSGGGFGTTLSDVTLPTDGTFGVAVEAADNQALGDFSIGLNRLGDSVPMPFDTVVSASLDQIGESDAFDFDGIFGTTATVDYSTIVAGQPDIVARLDLVRPNGTVASSTATCGGNARIDSALLDATGVWTVRVRGYESWFNCGYGMDTDLLTGNYTVALSTSDGPATTIAYGETQGGELFVDSQIVNYEFAGAFGDVATVVYYGTGYTRHIRLYAPNGSLIGTSGAGHGAAILDRTLPLNGMYGIAVEAADNQPVGTFDIGLSRLDAAAPISLNVLTGGVINQAAQVKQYSFNRNDGDVISIAYVTPTSTGHPDLAVRLDVVRPDTTIATTTASCSGTASINNISIDQTGEWTLRVRAYESWQSCGFGLDESLVTGSYTVNVCVNSCP